MTKPCPAIGELVEVEIDRILTQYRESPNLIATMRAGLGEVEQAILAICEIPDFFDINTAIGDQLTLIGKRLGFPRCHCVCVILPVFGFECGTGPLDIVGFCEGGTWIDCRSTGTSDICIDDDETYRALLMARRYQALGMYDGDSLDAAVEHIWGDAASAITWTNGTVVISFGRVLTAYEQQIRSIAFRALPIAPGVKVLMNESIGPFFGFGDGFVGFCDDGQWFCPAEPHIYDCA